MRKRMFEGFAYLMPRPLWYKDMYFKRRMRVVRYRQMMKAYRAMKVKSNV